MGLNDIELPASVVAALYSSSLVASGSIQPTPAAPPLAAATAIIDRSEPVPIPVAKPASATGKNEEFKWKFLGNNQQNILVVVNHDDILHLPDADLNFLTTMLTACKLGLGDVTLLNYDHYTSIGGPAIVRNFKSRTVLVFGLEPAGFGLPVNFPAFQVQALAGLQYLFAPALAEMSGDKSLKSKLWVGLQKIFSL